MQTTVCCIKAELVNRKTKQTGDVDSDGNPIELSDIDKESVAGTGDGGATVSKMETPKKRQKKVKVEKGVALAEKASVKDLQDGEESTKEVTEDSKKGLTDSEEKPKAVRKRTPKVATEAETGTGGRSGGPTDPIEEKTKTGRKKTAKKNAEDTKEPVAVDQDGPTVKEVSKRVAEEIEAKVEEKAGVVADRPEEVERLPPKKRGRPSRTKEVSKRVAEEIEAKAEEEGGVVADQSEEVEKLPPKKRGRPSRTKEVSKRVAEEIEAKAEEEGGVVADQPEEVEKLPPRRRGRPSQGKQLA